MPAPLPIGMWLPGVVRMGTALAKVVLTVGPWQVLQLVTPWCVAGDEKAL